MKTCIPALLRCLPLAVLASLTVSAGAAQVVDWADGFETATTGFDVNIETSRQTGAPLVYVGNPRPPATLVSDYHQQIIGPVAPLGDRLLLAGDGAVGLPFPDPTVGLALLSPDRNFKGPSTNGVLGTRITLDMDVLVNYDGTGQHFAQGGISIGASAVNTYGESPAPHFAVRMVEDTFGGNGNFIQFYDGATVVGNLIAHSAGTGRLALDLRISDPSDSDPWNGAGSTKIEVYGNGLSLGAFTKTGGGYTDNFITLEGSADFNGFGLGLHHFDNLTVYAGEDLTPLQAWRQIYFSTSANSGPGADNADPDNDGLANLVEYAAGQNPTVSNTSPLVLTDGPLLTVRHQRANAATDVTVILQESLDLSAGPWGPAGGEDVPISDDGEIVTFRRTLPMSGALAKFFRLYVTQP